MPSLVDGMAWSGFDRAVRSVPGGAVALFRAIDVALDVIDRPGLHTPLQKYLAYFELASQLTGDDNFGLNLGSRTRAERSGIPGHLVLNARRFRDALSDLAWSMPTLVGGVSAQLAESRDPPALLWSLPADAGPAVQFTGHANAYFVRMMQAHRGKPWRPQRVVTTIPYPIRPQRYRAVFGCPVIFDAPVNAIEVTQADLRTERPGVNPHLHTLLTSLARMLMDKMTPADEGLEARTRLALRDGLNLGRVDLAFVAARLGLSPRGVQRALAETGLSFATLRDAERFALATKLLRNRTMSVGEIASRLGYAETAAFSRAFRRYQGANPRSVRRAGSLFGQDVTGS